MSLDRPVIGIVLVLAATAYAQEFNCPASEGKSPLFNAAVFDGPPAEKAELAPDVSKGKMRYAYASWDVGYLYGMGHNVFLVCKYAGLPEAQNVTIKVDRKVQQCIFRAPNGQPAEAPCR